MNETRQPRKIQSVVEAVFEVTTVEAVSAWEDDQSRQVIADASEFDGPTQTKQNFAVETNLNLTAGSAVTATPRHIGNVFVGFRSDGTAAAHVGASLCSFNALRPYEAFDTYLPRINRLFNAWLSRVPAHGGLNASQRYINVVEFSADQHPHEWLRVVPDVLVGRASPVVFNLQAIGPADDDCGVQLYASLLGGSTDTQRWRLDLTAMRPRAATPFGDINAVIAWHRSAHAILRQWFRDALTDKALETYELEERG
jgi:uncharacterized protein (TIGR04255 family)